MSAEMKLTSKFLVNPLDVTSEGSGVYRLVVGSARPFVVDGHMEPRPRYNVGIEFSRVHHGSVVEQGSAHSYAMTAEVLGIAPERTSALTEEQVAQLLEDVESGKIAVQVPAP